MAKKQDNLYNARDFLTALRQVETKGHETGHGVKGDWNAAKQKYDALGPYQIHAEYYHDAAEFNKAINPHRYQDTLNSTEFSEEVINSYMLRYAKAEWSRLKAGKGTPSDMVHLARIHNGGPKGYTKEATLEYRDKFNVEISQIKPSKYNPNDPMLTRRRVGGTKVPPRWLFSTPEETFGLGTHRIQEGDSFWKIAEAYYGRGSDWAKIVEYNGLDPRGRIPRSQHGQVIYIPHEDYDHEESWQ